MHTEFWQRKEAKLIIIKLNLRKKILRLLSDLSLFRIEFVDMLLW